MLLFKTMSTTACSSVSNIDLVSVTFNLFYQNRRPYGGQKGDRGWTFEKNEKDVTVTLYKTGWYFKVAHSRHV